MSIGDFYFHKVAQCDLLVAAAADPRERARFQDEGALWREIARDIVKQERDEGGPH